jgi:hypothetical protein
LKIDREERLANGYASASDALLVCGAITISLKQRTPGETMKLCASCGLEILPARLKAQPGTRLCVACAQERENRARRPVEPPVKVVTLSKTEMRALEIYHAEARAGHRPDIGRIRELLRKNPKYVSDAELLA